MADGLSLVASIIAVISAADGITKILTKVKILRDAPDDLLALYNEISDLTVTLHHLNGCVLTNTSERTTQDVLGQVTTLIDKAKDQVLQLDKLIHYKLLKSGSLDGDYKIFRLRWARAKSTIEKHRVSLRDIRQNLVIQILSVNCSRQSRAHLIIDEVFQISNQIQSAQIRSTEQNIEHLNAQSQVLAQISNEQVILRSALQARMPSKNPQSQAMESNNNLHPQTILGIRAHVMTPQPRQCFPCCDCCCHRPRRIKSPRMLNNVLGALFVGYFGCPFNFQSCTISTCQNPAVLMAQVQYIFPSWLLWKMIDLRLIMSTSQEPCLSLLIRAVRPDVSDIFMRAIFDDVDGLKDLFSSGRARPNDLSRTTGDTALSYAVMNCSFNACKMLLSAGTDPHIEDSKQISVFTRIWNVILSTRDNQPLTDTLKGLFPDNDNHLDNRQFSILHKIVLGLIDCSLEEQLVVRGTEVDALDSMGKTALSWAVSRQDIATIRLLLVAKANPNLPTYLGHSPLMIAAGSQNLAIVKILLEAGALTTKNTVDGHTTSHYVCSKKPISTGSKNNLVSGQDVSSEIIKRLVAAGDDVRCQNHWGDTLLHLLSMYDECHSANLLLDLGAEIDAVNNDGDTPVMTAIYYRCDSITELFLRRGANYTISNRSGDTILHAIAWFGTLQTIDIVRSANIMIDPYYLNNDGKTAFEVAQQREKKPDGFIDLFLTLLFEIRNRNDHSVRQRAVSNGSINGDVDGSELQNQIMVKESLTIPGAWPEY